MDVAPVAQATDWKLWSSLAQWLVTGALAIVMWTRKPGEDAAKAVEALRRESGDDIDAVQQAMGSDMAAIRERVTRLEEHIKHVPTSDELSELEGEVKAMSATVHAVAESIGTIRLTLNRIETYILNGSAR